MIYSHRFLWIVPFLFIHGGVDVDPTADDSEMEDPEDLVQLLSEGEQDT